MTNTDAPNDNDNRPAVGGQVEILVRPDCWDFAMSFLGEPEAPEAERYVTALEAEIARLRGIDVKVLEVAVAVVARALDELVGACMGDDSKPRAPDRGSLMRARAMLPPVCKHAFKKA